MHLLDCRILPQGLENALVLGRILLLAAEIEWLGDVTEENLRGAAQTKPFAVSRAH